MQCGPVVLRYVALHTCILSSLMGILCLGVQRSNLQLLVRVAKKQSKYHAMANVAVELIWVSYLFHELQSLPWSCPTLLCNNKTAIFMSQNLVARKRAKHIDLDYHFICELLSSGELFTQFVPSHLQLADIFTKSLPRQALEFLRSKLCVSLRSTQCLRKVNRSDTRDSINDQPRILISNR